MSLAIDEELRSDAYGKPTRLLEDSKREPFKGKKFKLKTTPPKLLLEDTVPHKKNKKKNTMQSQVFSRTTTLSDISNHDITAKSSTSTSTNDFASLVQSTDIKKGKKSKKARKYE